IVPMATTLDGLEHVRRPVAADQRVDGRDAHGLDALLQLVGTFAAQYAADGVPCGLADAAGVAARLGGLTLGGADVVDGDGAALPVRGRDRRTRRDEQVEPGDAGGALLPID